MADIYKPLEARIDPEQVAPEQVAPEETVTAGTPQDKNQAGEGYKPDVSPAAPGTETGSPEGFDPTAVQSLSDVDPEQLLAPEPPKPAEDDGGPSKSTSLESIGVKWADHGGEQVLSKNLFDKQAGFYELDYDPTGKEGISRFGTKGVVAANVFGRQFTREELDKHEEGRKLVAMMEGIRSGAYRGQGFVAGVTNFDRTNVPFLGNLTEIGTSVSEAIDISRAMRKMQRGEAVTDDEALGVRRFMLQQDIESGRSFGYGVGSVIRQAPTFMAEMALAGKVMAATTAAGTAIGGAVGGIVAAPTGPGAVGGAAAGAAVGGKIGAAVGLVVTMGATLWSRASKAIGRRMAARAVEKALGDFTARTVEKGFTAAEGQMIRKAVGSGSDLFSKATRDAIRAEMAEKLGAGATKQAISKAANFEMYRRAAASVVTPTVAGKTIDVGLATRMAVQGDVKNLVSGEFARGLEAIAFKLGSGEGVSEKSVGYFARQKILREGWKKLDDATLQAYRKAFVSGTVDSMADGIGKTAAARGIVGMGGGADRLVSGSMSQVIGKTVSKDNSFARAVTERIIENQLKSMQLKYAGKGMFNGMERFGRYVGDHALNGLLRWDMSAFGGGSGTIARSGSVLGGKMAALKEAVGIACIEAPVRGALQLGVQAPMWPVAAGLSGRNPADFVLRGQLGNQATALRTGDRDLMDHARAVAFGSLLVEYASENAGRGLETAAGGILKPMWQSTFLAKPTERVGSFMAQKINAMFGFDKAMLPSHNAKLAEYVSKTLRNKITGAEGDRILSRVTEQEIKKLVETRSLESASDALKEAVSKAGFKNLRELLVGSVQSEAKLTKWRAATQYLVADYMVRKGFTPQKFNALLERVGYDGVIAEMAEERYGGFLQGLFGLNDRPSNEGWSGRWKAAMEGLFPDREQLLTEAIAFSVPSVANMSMQSLYRSIGEGGGGMSGIQEDLATLRSASSPRASVSIPGVTSEFASKLKEAKEKVDAAVDSAVGSKEDNAKAFREAVATAAQSGGLGSAATEQAKGRMAPLRDARSRQELDVFADELAEELSKEGTYESLQAKIAELGGEAAFGKDGIAAVENLWRRQSGHSFADTDAREQAIAAPAAELRSLAEQAPLHSGPADVSSILGDITVQLGVGSEDTGVLGGAARRGGEGNSASVNMFDENVSGEVADAMAHLGKTAYGMERGMRKDLSLTRRAAMRLVGIVDGLTTGNWALASANPMQYAYEDMALPRDMMGRLMNEYKGCLDVARRRLVQSGEKVTEERMEEIADEIMGKRTASYASAFLAASNVLAVSKSDIGEAALRVVAYNSRRADGKFDYQTPSGTSSAADSFRDAAFVAAHEQDIADAKKEIMSELVMATVNGILVSNHHAEAGHREAMAVNLSRAMQNGTKAEIMAAISELPAFRSLHKVYDVSGLSQEYSDIINSGLFGRAMDTSVIENVDTSPEAVLSPEQTGSLCEAMGRDMTLYTEQENMEAAKKFAAQVKAVVDSGLNVRFEDRRGTGADARQVSVTRDPVSGEFTVTYEEQKGGAIRTEKVTDITAATALLDSAGFDSISKRIVFTTYKSITFSDALSGLMFLNQDNLRAARAEMVRRMGLVEGTFSEDLLPHLLRMDAAGRRFGFTDSVGRFVSTENDAGRIAAAEAIREMREKADRADRTQNEDDVRAKAIVYGGTVNGQALVGWETAAGKAVTARGAVRAMEDASARAAGLTEGWSFRPGSLPCGDTLVIMRDYDNHVDSEAMLRTALSTGMRSGLSRTPAADRQARDAILVGMAREFRKAAESIVDKLDPLKDAGEIDAVRMAVASVLGEEGATVNMDGLAAIAASCGFFTSERGLAEDGNGYLFQPELAAIADVARESEVFPYFLSVMDELLGGTGFFTVERASVSGLARLRDAFSPKGDDVRMSRRSSMFSGGDQGRTGRVAKPEPGVPRLRWTKEGLRAGANSPHSVTYDKFVGVPEYMAAVADACHGLAGGFKDAYGRPPSSTAEVYRLLHAAEFAGNTSARASVSSEALGSDRPAASAKGIKGKVDAAAATTATTVHGLSSDEIDNRTAVSMAKNFLFLMPDGSGKEGEKKARAELERFLNERGMSAPSRSKVLAAFSVAVARKTRYGERAEQAAALHDTDKELEAKSEGANADVFLENERRDAVIENDDLMDCGSQFRFLFPVEATNYTAVLYRVRNELTSLASAVASQAPVDGSPFARVAEALNVFATPRDADAAAKLASVETFADDKVTDELLSRAISALRELGRTDLAFVLSALKNIPQTESRRGKALRLVGQMTPVSGFYAQQDAAGGFSSARQGSRAPRASIDAVRAVISAPFYGKFVKGAFDQRTGRSSFGTRLAALNNFVAGNAAAFEKYHGDYAWFGGATIDEVRSLLGPAASTVDAGSLEFLGSMKRTDVTFTNDFHEAAVAYVRDLRARMLGTADAIERMFGPNEICYVLRNPAFAEHRIREVENLVKETDNADDRKAVADGLIAELENFQPGDAAMSRFINGTFMWPVFAASRIATGKSGPAGFYALNAVDESGKAGEKISKFMRALRGEVSRLATRGILKESITKSLKQNVFGTETTGKMQSPLSRLIGIYAVSMPRSTEVLTGKGSGGFRDSSRTTMMPASPAPAALAIEDSILSALSVPAARSGAGAVSVHRGFWNRAGVEKDSGRTYLFGDNTSDRASGYVPSSTQAVIRGLPNAIGIDTKKTRGTKDSDYFTDADFDAFKSQVDAAIAKAKGLGREIVLPEDGIGTGKAELEKRAPKLYGYLQQELRKLWSAGTAASPKSVLDEYLSNGGRFEDGSLLVQVSLGAKNRFGELMDDQFRSMAVNEANKADYIVRNDCSYLRFQLYHGEKPTSYSIQLPGYVAQALFEKAMSEAGLPPEKRTALPSRIPDNVDMGLLADVTDIREVGDERARESVYRLLYAAVASAARCDQISPKRVQVLMSQGTMTAAFRDSHVEVQDGNLVEVDDREGGVVPGHHVVMTLGGKTATSLMGMWFDHGYLVDALRAMSTNPKTVSFKTHNYSLKGAFFQKGQGHDLGIGVVPVIMKDGKYSIGKSRYGKLANSALEDVQRKMRRAVASSVGLRGDSMKLLEPLSPSEFDALPDEEKRARYEAYEAYRSFCKHSTVRGTDNEANKAGPFGSECGAFSADGIVSVSHEKYGTLYFDAEAGMYSDSVETGPDGKRSLSNPRKVPSFSMEAEVKYGAAPILWVVSAYMKAATKESSDPVTGERKAKALSASDVGKLVSTWRRPDGSVAENVSLADSGIFSDYGSAEGDRLSVEDDGDSATATFFTRKDVSQIVANSDAPASASTEHPYASNAIRDAYLNETRRVDATESATVVPDTVAAAVVNRLVNFASLFCNSAELVDARVAKDPELSRNLMMFPFDLRERNREFRKKNSVYARSMRLPVYSTHAILLPSGGHVVKADTVGHDVVIEWAPGTDEFTKDMLRVSRFYGTAEKDFYGMGQSYSSGQVNILDDGSFRYGMAVDEKRLADFVRTFGESLGIGSVKVDPRLAKIVGADDARTMAVVAKCVAAFRDRASRGANVVLDEEVVRSSETLAGASKELSDAFGAAFGTGGLETEDTVTEERERGVAVNPFSVFLGCFTDYTGMHLNDRGHRDVSAMSFDDLFMPDGTFDYAAIDRRTSKLGDGRQGEALFVGGSFFSGSRRPSGNVEAAGGFCRATMPVVFDSDGKPKDCAMYVLDPLLNFVQGSDTDGDSSSIIVRKCSSPASDSDAVRHIARMALSAYNAAGEAVRGDYSAYVGTTRKFYRDVRARYPEFFDEDGSASERFGDAIANMLFDVELENVRKSPAFHQGPADGKVAGIPDGPSPVFQMSAYADNAGRPVPNVGAVGRRPVGPGIVGGELKVGAARAKKLSKYGITAGMSFKKAFSAYVDSRNPERKGTDMLDPDVAAARSDAAADANGARGVMVLLQATVEHVAAMAASDPKIRSLCPALYEKRDDGYDPTCDFIGHLDGVSNALFDVVKDLFAPRAGWKKEMLTYMVGRFLAKADADWRKDRNVRFDDGWFFDQALSFLDDMLDPSTYAGSVLLATEDADGFGTGVDGVAFDAKAEDTLFDALMDAAGSQKETFDRNGKTGYYVYLSRMVSAASGPVLEKTDFSGFRKAVSEAYGVPAGASAFGRLAEMVEDRELAVSGVHRNLLLAKAMMTPVSDLSKRKNGVSDAYEAYVGFRTMNRLRALESPASPDKAFRGGNGTLGTYERSSQLDNKVEGKDGHEALFSENNAAKVLLNAAAGTNMRRISDEVEDVLDEASDMKDDLRVIASSSEHAYDLSFWASVTPTIASERTFDGDWRLAEKSHAVVRASLGKRDSAPESVIASNREMLHHVIGAVCEMDPSARETAEQLFAERGTEGFRKFVASGMERLIADALERGMYSEDVRTFLSYMMADPKSGEITFLSKPSSEDARAVQRGFEELVVSKDTVEVEGNELPVGEVAQLFQLHAALSGKFSGAVDPRVRPNVAVFFSPDRINRMERWGTGVYSHPASRLLCGLAQAAGSSAFNLGFSDPKAGSAFSVVVALTDPSACSYANSFASSRTVLNSTAMQAREAAEDGRMNAERGFSAEGVSFALREGVKFRVGGKGAWRVAKSRGEFRTLEEAYNDILDQVLSAHFGRDGLATGGAAVADLVGSVPARGMVAYAGLDELDTLKRILLSTLNGPDGSALSKALAGIDSRALDFSKSVDRVPGVTRRNAPAVLACKEYAATRASTLGGNAKASVDEGPSTGSVAAGRMRRGDIRLGAKGGNVAKNVSAALEAAFGKMTDEGGVKVTRVKRNGRYVDLLKVERRFRTKNGTKTVTTYVSYGDRIDVAESPEYAESAFRAMKARGYAGTLDDVRALSADELRAVVESLGLAVNGDSRTGLDTQGLLMLTGVIRLGDGAGMRTLFHEYFHQAYSFFSKTGVLSDLDGSDLLGSFHSGDGTFDEEAAADAFADYVTDIQDGDRKVSSSGKKVDAVFKKIYQNCKAYLEGASSQDLFGHPAFMRILVTGDLTDRDTSELDRRAEEQYREIEDALLGEEVDFGSVSGKYRTAEASAALSELAAAVVSGKPASEVASAASKAASKAAAQFEAVQNSTSAMEEGAQAPAPARTRTNGAPTYQSETTPVGKMQVFFKTALERFGADSSPLGLSEQQELRRLRDHASMSELPASDVGQLAATARRVIADTADFLGIRMFESRGGVTKLTEDGKKLLSDDAVTEMTIRLCHKMNEVVASENRGPGGNPFARSATHASADQVYGRMLAEVAPANWPSHASGKIAEAADAFRSAAAELRRRSDSIRPSDSGRADRMGADAAKLELLASRMSRAFTLMLGGSELHDVQAFADTRGAGGTYGNLFDGVRHELLEDGRKRYFGGSYSDDAVSLPEFQSAFDAAATAFFSTACARSYLRKIGQDFPPVGSQPTVPPGSPQPDPGFGLDESDVSAQMILQTPGAWMAADMLRDFMGVDARELLTDHDVRSKTESANSFASTMDFVFAADCHAGEKPREIDFVDSDVGFDPTGVDVHDERLRHSAMRTAAVRGYALGLVTRDARRAGRELAVGDDRTIAFTLQFVNSMACGDDRLLTGIDLPWPNRETLNRVLQYGAGGLLNGPLSRTEVMKRVNRYRGERAISDVPLTEGAMPCNIDHLFYRMYEAIPESYLNAGMLEDIAKALIKVATESGSNTGTAASGDARTRLAKELCDAGYAEMSADGRCVLAIPVSYAKKAWEASSAYAGLLEAGRTQGMLNLDYWAARTASEANSLHRVAARSRYLRGPGGRSLTSAGANGTWFYHGSGAHALDVEKYENAKDVFDGKPSADEKMDVAFSELKDVLARHVSTDPSVASKGTMRAFGLTDGRSGEVRVNGQATHRQIQFLIKLLSRYGVTVRDSRGRLVPLHKNFNPTDFVAAVMRGEFSYSGRTGLPVFLDADSTLNDFDRAIYVLTVQAVSDEITGIGTGIDGLGSKQGLIDANELVSRLEAALGETDRGRVTAVSPQQMFRTRSALGSSMTASQNLRAMCEEIVTAERYKGCMTQMLQSVGPDGAMNYIVKPTEQAAAVLPDEYWGALARFTYARNRGVPGVKGYDSGKSGVENMRDIFDSLGTKEASDHLSLASKGTSESFRTPVRYGRHVDLHAYKADRLFEDMLVRSDGPMDEANAADAAVGGQQAGYMKQLLGMVGRPGLGTAAKWSQIDRIMSYSKAASVGISAFFAFATRFESPVAACGLWHALAGFTDSSFNTDKCAKAMRKVGEKFGRAGQTGAFESDAVFLADILRAITSNDPYVREMREMCDLIGMPLTDSIQNPVTDRMGAIDHDIERICKFAERNLGVAYSKRIRSGMKAALHNPSEYAFSNVLNGVKMAVVSQTLRRLRTECREQNRPFDPVKELRKHSAYINSEIGGIDPGRYAFLTPQTQRVLGRTMFSYQWTLGAWTAGAGDVVTDLVFGGHHTTPEMRRFAFIRWLRMIGYIKVGVPVVMQIAIKALATAIAAAKGNPPGDDDDPYGIEAMPWLCFNNEEKIGPLSFDVTPLLRLAGSSETLRDAKNGKGAWPYLSAVAGAAVGYGVTRGPIGALIGAAVGATSGKFVPAYVGRGKNSTGNRRYYMHFGKQSDEFWRWFTDFWQQATGKLSIPTQKAVEAFFGSTNGSSFAKPFAKKSLSERFFTISLDPNESATANFFTAFLPFSAASVAGHPDAGLLGMLGPVQMGASKTYVQKKLVDRLLKFAEDERHSNPWAHPDNKASLEVLCGDILADADKNGVDPKDILTSAIGQAASREYGKLFSSLPRDVGDNQFDVEKLTAALRALARLGRKQQAILMALGKRYKAAGVDWEKQPNAATAEMVRELVEGVMDDPYNWGDRQYAELVGKYASRSEKDVRRADVSQDAKGGTNSLAGFLASDDVPETLFGIPVVSRNYTEDDLEFFRDNPDAGGYYDMGDPEGPTGPESGPEDGGPGSPTSGDKKGGESGELPQRGLLSALAGGSELPVPNEGVGGSAFSAERFLKAFEATKGTEKDVYRELYKLAADGLDADFQYDRAMRTRIAQYDDASQKRLTELYEAGKVGLEDVPIVDPEDTHGRPMRVRIGSPGESGTMEPAPRPSWDEGRFMSRKSKNARHPGEIRMVGNAASSAGSHVSETARLNGSGSNWDASRAAEDDRTGRSAAYPGDSTAVVHRADAVVEELMHLLTRSYTSDKSGDNARDDAATQGFKNHKSNYYGFGNRAERRNAMSVLKAAMAADGLDAGKSEDRERYFSGFEKDNYAGIGRIGSLPMPDNAKGLLHAILVIRKHEKDGGLVKPAEINSAKDMKSDTLWKMADNSTHGTGNTGMA